MLEVEYKALISEDIYEKIRKHYTWDWSKEQTNHYYTDSDGILSKQHITVRVREKDGECKVQVKAHRSRDNALHICEESEFPVDSVPEKISSRDALKYTNVQTGDLSLLGSLTTLRNSLMWCDNVEICLDRSEYFDRTDYEIEVEYTGEFPPQLMAELKELGVEFREKSKGKYTRFITRMLEIMRGM